MDHPKQCQGIMTAEAVKAAIEEEKASLSSSLLVRLMRELERLVSGSLESLGDPHSEQAAGNTEEGLESFHRSGQNSWFQLTLVYSKQQGLAWLELARK